MTLAVFTLLLLGAVPIALVLALTAAWYIVASGNTLLFVSYPQQLFGAIEHYGLLAIPLFMLAGELMNEGGLTRRLIDLARILVGGFRGGLVYINLVANMMMAAIVGSAASQIAIMSRAMVPAMEQEGYDKPFSAAITAAGGLMSPIIPPSMLFVLYGVIAQVPIADMFVAGILPGLLMGLLFFIAITVIGLVEQYPKGDWPSRDQARAYLLMGVPAMSIPLIIIGGILSGLATPTESAALASLAALLIGRYVYRDLTFARLPDILRRTAFNAGLVIMLIAAAGVFGWVIIYEQLPQMAAAWIASLTTDPFIFLLLVIGVLLLVGMIIDGIAALILVVPILLPIATQQFDITPYQFGVVVSLTLVLGLLTPPVGAGLFISSSMTGVPPMQIFRALLPFLAMSLIALVLLAWQPWLTLALL
ncbi:TRAP transporter large permease [Vreelandella alkaliphila]|uniref:TRAP transporter large permease protein n=1 Tax=Vreelandella alkaliphila TaxID=272774 RepID=A0ABX4HD85_9GAMM|nr:MULTISPECIES: TRAP transporter large permease [Halomonas]AYF33004.1 TRAP transporter large permease [Halomonas alkaliphila]MCD6005972.1 TRAP transporter large permease [Halomonas sp. IOP_6]MCD6438771.1 TRAP transporter large permease [Halomonas sp.]PAU70372.1 C4-dicarboxylate ABC transporter permease [Halomonas humidisoli]